MANTDTQRRSYGWIFFLLFTGFLVALFFYVRQQFGGGKPEITADVMVQKITQMGKLELVKYSMKDVIEQKDRQLILPDKKVLFVAVGEVAGCIDLTRVKASDIQSTPDSVTVFLPAPEICYAKIDHEKSKVYDVSGYWFTDETKTAVEGIYKIAEQRLRKNASEMNVLGKTKENAQLIFKPLLQNIAGKKVGIVFR